MNPFQMFIDLISGGFPDPSRPENTVINPQWVAQEAQLHSSVIDSSSNMFDSSHSMFDSSSTSIEISSAPSYYDFNSGL
jgi:hypothetical protein